jgi:omega-hydroxy-beta-dihydromenaquinone-9 sulfotransferase
VVWRAEVGPVFIGGTGRSGTSQLNRVLGEHPGLWSSSIESRLVCDPGGLGDLLGALSADPDPYTSADALQRFEILVRNQPEFAAVVGAERFWKVCGALVDELTSFEVQEREVLRRRLKVSCGFTRPHLAARLGRFLHDVFEPPTTAAGAERWVEKTPWNILRAPALFELCPDATLLHAVRHPVQVVASYVNQHWAPTNVPDTVAWLEPVYRGWFRLVDSGVLAGRRVLTVRIEELASDWESRRPELFDGLGLPDHETPSSFEPARVTARTRLGLDDEHLVRDRLGGFAARLGYER